MTDSSIRLMAPLAAIVLFAAPALAQTDPPPAAPAQPSPAAATPAPATPPTAKPPAQKPAPKPGQKTVDAITVTATQPDVTTSIDRKSFSLSKDIVATTGSIADALRNLPSVEVDLQGNLSLRGDPNVTILVDGKPAPQFEGPSRADALQQLPADQYERVEVITNPSAALNPEGSGGVINLITKKSRGAGVTGSAYGMVASAGLKRAGLNLGYNSPKLSVTGSISGNYQRNKSHSFETRGALDPATGKFDVSDQRFIGRNLTRVPSGRVNLSYAATPTDQLTLSVAANQLFQDGHPYNEFTGLDSTGAVTSELVRQGERTYHEIDTSLTGGWKHTFSEGHELSLDVVDNNSDYHEHILWQAFANTPPTSAPFESVQDSQDERHREARLGYNRPLAAGTLKAGYELKTDANDYNNEDYQGATPPTVVPVPALFNRFAFDQTINDVYATYERAFGNLDVLAGLRVDDDRLEVRQLTEGRTDRQAYTKLFPTLHMTWKAGDDGKFSASFSDRIQRPPPEILNPRLYVFDPRNIAQGNPQLKPSVTESYEAGYEQHVGRANLQATLYYRRRVDDFTSILVDLGNGVFKQTFDNLGSSRSSGLELNANGSLGKALTYNLNLNGYWTQVDASNLALAGVTGPAEAWGASGRANLNWQVTANDLAQVNAQVYGKRLSAQGETRPSWSLNLGWRHKLNDRLTATVTAQDVFATTRFHRILETPTLFDDFLNEPRARYIYLRLDYRFGGGKGTKEPGFEYENAGPPG
jgi:outer membrane receptor protein involved in Fe transport